MSFRSTKRTQRAIDVDLADATARMQIAARSLHLIVIQARHASSAAERFTERVENQIVNKGAP
ncbi:hypothetical protein [Streptomyces sp. BH105]|uniref:hypothetical protein n=1 Tax=Streptomyces sp. BH105 TaxID=3410408 RepID=UPI003CEAF1E9